MKRTYLYLLTIFLLINTAVLAQSEVRFGPRPPIDLSAVSPEHVEHERFRLRFTREAGSLLDQQPIIQQHGAPVFSMQSVDQLAASLGVTDATATFAGPAMRQEYNERHRQWGLHLWYDIHVEAGQDILDVVRQFALLPEVDVAEPVYLKQMVAGEVFEWDEDSFITQEEAEGWIPDDPQFGAQWHYHNTGQTNGTPGADINLPAAWEIEKGDSTILVAIIDDGIQFNHPDLEANMWDGIGFNFVNNSANVVPGDHGTHVAGTVAAVSNNNVGVAGVAGGSGIGDGVRLMSAQVFQGNSSGGFANSFIWSADNGAAITQNSWGYTAPGVFEQAVLDAIDYFNANGGGDALDGGITIFAAGNSGDSGDYYPGFYEGAMSVASTNHEDQKAWYSTYGSWVDISAPGGETNVNSQGVLSTVTGSGYAFYQGTSMACPHVSGVAALVLSKAPGQFTNEELRDLLVSSVDNHYGVNPSFVGQLGSGRINALKALQEVDNYLIGLINPSQFALAGTGVDEVSLSWIRNPDNDPVLLAFSEDGFFGTPEGSYEAGDELEGGGTVLLFGEHEEFVHGGLESATQYYYMIWSKKDSLYSSGRMGSASTFCDILMPPYAEFFDEPSLPLCWESTGGWQVGSFSGGLNIDGNYAYSGTGLGGAQNADLFSPLFDFSQFENISISFQHYYRGPFLGGGSGTFYYSTDNGSTWTSVQSWTSSTANPASFEVTIDELAGEGTVLFRWNNSVGFLGYYWTVGEIEINGEPLEAPELFVHDEELSVELDAGDSTELELLVANHGEVNLEIHDVTVEYENDSPAFISVSPVTLTLEPGEEDVLTIHFNAEDLDEGEYHAAILIHSNDPFVPVMGIPAVMHVMAVYPSSITEIVMESEEHNTLATALELAGLLGALEGEGPFTLFAPTDNAFDALPEGLLDDLLGDPEGALADILLYHVAEGFVLSTDLEDGQEITTLLGEEIVVSITEDGVFINDAQVIVADLEAENGVVHVIDAVLTPPLTVVDIITGSEDHTILTTALEAAGLLETLGGEGPFTVFAPPDNAFDALPDGLLEELLDDPEGALTELLLYHVVEGYALSGDLADGQDILTMLGEEVVVSITGDGIFINDALVIVADLEADNGVVHVIDAVLTGEEEDTTNLSEVTSLRGLTVYPNPARGQVWLELGLEASEEPLVEIYSLTGELLMRQHTGALGAGEHLVSLPIHDLSAGLYILTVSTAGERKAVRLQVY